MEKSNFSWRKRAASFKYALQGVVTMVRDEHNMRIHLVAAVIAVAMGVVLHISAIEWIVVTLCICGVIAAEATNTAIESLCDKVSQERDPLIKRSKDCAAAAVLIIAIGAAIVGSIIFLPKIIALF